jgi:hypothetical protein
MKENNPNFYSNIEEFTLKKHVARVKHGNLFDTTDEWIDALLNAYELATVTFYYQEMFY